MRHTFWLLIVLAGTGSAQWRRFGEERQAIVQSSLARGMLAAHNAVRARVGIAALAWSDRLAARPQDWADTLLARKAIRPPPELDQVENTISQSSCPAPCPSQPHNSPVPETPARHYLTSNLRMAFNSCRRFAVVLGYARFNSLSLSRTICETINRTFSLSSAGTTYQGA